MSRAGEVEEQAIRAIPGLDDSARAILGLYGKRALVPAGTVIFRPGQACEQLVLLARGMVRVRIHSESGREIELYRVLPGETCVLSLACLMGERPYEAEGIAESDLAGLAIDRGTLRRLLDGSSRFREMVLAVQTRRIYELIALVDVVAFHRTEARLASHLLQRCDEAMVVAETHQALAHEIGTAREVVSRRLKRLEAAGIVALERGRVLIRDARKLKEMAAG